MDRKVAAWIVAAALAVGCTGAREDLFTKAGSATLGPSAAQLGAMAVNDAGLCETGSIAVQFQRARDSFAFGMMLAAGDEIRVEATGDPSLDTVVYLVGPLVHSFYDVVPAASDDDSAGSHHSLISGFTVVTGGEYAVVVSTYEGDGVGNAVLRVSVNGQPGCTFAVLSLSGPWDGESADAAEGDESTGDAGPDAGCLDCCTLVEATSAVILQGDSDYAAFPVTEQDFPGSLVPVPLVEVPTDRHHEFLLVDGQVSLPLYYGGRQALSDLLEAFRGCPIRVTGKLTNQGYGMELWPSTVSFNP